MNSNTLSIMDNLPRRFLIAISQILAALTNTSLAESLIFPSKSRPGSGLSLSDQAAHAYPGAASCSLAPKRGREVLRQFVEIRSDPDFAFQHAQPPRSLPGFVRHQSRDRFARLADN